jgi:unconventional prefoldin RPB5 interactor 1
LLGDKVGVNRGRDAVLNAVAKRIDYVDENIQKLKKQVDILEGDDYEEEKGAGESLMDIQEELDEDGNVTSRFANAITY